MHSKSSEDLAKHELCFMYRIGSICTACSHPAFFYIMYMKAYGGGGWSIVPRIPKLGARWKRVVSISPRLLYPPAKYHSTHSTGGWVDLEQIWTFKRRENLLPLPGIEPRTAPFDVCRAVLKECEEKVAVINCILNRYISVHLRREPLDSSTAQCVLCIAKSHI